MSQLPNIRPSLLLDFANARSLDPRVTFERLSGGTHFNAQGLLVTAGNNRPRFDHDPVTGQSLGLLVEESRTNLLLRSEEFNVLPPWATQRSNITANVTTTTAPDGTNTADKLVEDTTANNSHSLSQQVTTIAGDYTVSFYVKAAERSYIQLRIQEGGSFRARAEFNLATGVAIPVSGSLPTISPAGNGWFRVSLGFTSTGSSTCQPELWLYDSTPSNSYTGDGTSGIFIWGAQLEAGAFPTSYIPTTGATATRAADVASMTGSNFSGWYSQSEGTMFADFFPRLPADSNVFYLYRLHLNTTDHISIRSASGYSPDRVFPAVISGNITQFTGEATAGSGYITMPRAGFEKHALAYKADDFAGSWNGGSPLLDTSGTVPVCTALYIGSSNNVSAFVNGHIRKLAFYPRRLSNTELQELTK